MATTSPEPVTNARIVRLLEEVRAELAESKQRDQRLARDLARLLGRK